MDDITHLVMEILVVEVRVIAKALSHISSVIMTVALESVVLQAVSS